MSSDTSRLDANAPAVALRRGVVAVVRREQRLLVILRSQFVRAPGMFCFPGGGIEEGEQEVEALQREMLEELAVESKPFRRLWQSTSRWGVHLAWWLTTLNLDAELRPNLAEVESVHWFTPEEIRRLPNVLPTNLDFLNALDRDEFSLDYDS
jgi:8-oxo-dGTP diphosphatase